MSDIKKLSQAKNHGSVIAFPKRTEGREQPPRKQAPPWEAAYGPNVAEVWVLHPTLHYDLQNLPFDPAEGALKQLEQTIRNRGKPKKK